MARTTEAIFKRADSPYWYAWVPDPRTGKSVPRSTKCRAQGDAAAWRRRAMQSHQDPANPARGVTLETVLNTYLESRSSGLAPRTREGYQQKLSTVAAVLGGDLPVARLTAATLDSYIATRRAHKTKRRTGTVTDHTIAHELDIFKRALRLAKRRGLWAGDVDVVFPSSADFSSGYDPRKSSERALSRADVAKLAAVLTPRKFAVLAYAIATSAEMAGLHKARRSDTAPDRSVVRVHGTKTRDRARDVPIATLEQALLLEYALAHADGAGDALFSTIANLGRDFAQAARKAGVHHFSPHNARHTLASWFTAAGVHSAVAGALLGHANGTMVERTYGHLRKAEDVRSALTAQYRPPSPASPPTERFLSGNGGGSGEDGSRGNGDEPSNPAQLAAPASAASPDSGFLNRRSPVRIRPGTPVSDTAAGPLWGFCEVADPAAADAAVRAAITTAVNAGLYARAHALLGVMVRESDPNA